MPLEDNSLSLSLTKVLQIISFQILWDEKHLSFIKARPRPLDGVDISLIKTVASTDADMWEPRDISIVFGK